MRPERIDVRRVAVVEESVLQRNRAAQLLTDTRGLEVVHTGASLPVFMAWLRTTRQLRWPHLLITDLPPGDDSPRDLEMLTALREAGMKVIALSALRNRSIARRAIITGIDGVVSTADSEADLLGAVEAVLRGGVVITPQAHAAIYASTDVPRLSHQEERALALYATGMTIAEVAEKIGVKQDTARKYLKRVRDKFTRAGRPARSKLDLARIAWAEGLTSPTNPIMLPSDPEGSDAAAH